ncbi:hypothetical protein BK138_20490 [Paenibacillus rhizosphaerae]|uniref:Uncharacterized protein n=1 Tax=Paenibacillus rhizosphaerae TaxID=297318 RepID=A0A1R1ENC6_9BACL|nr:hypothetical protein BK138_20490 [Paenibacillus rhizosphaerae]
MSFQTIHLVQQIKNQYMRKNVYRRTVFAGWAQRPYFRKISHNFQAYAKPVKVQFHLAQANRKTHNRRAEKVKSTDENPQTHQPLLYYFHKKSTIKRLSAAGSAAAQVPFL